MVKGFTGVNQSNRSSQIPGASAVGALEIWEPIIHLCGAQAQSIETGIQYLSTSQAFDQKVGGGVVAHTDHFSGDFMGREPRAERFGGHPAGSPTHNGLS